MSSSDSKNKRSKDDQPVSLRSVFKTGHYRMLTDGLRIAYGDSLNILALNFNINFDRRVLETLRITDNTIMDTDQDLKKSLSLRNLTESLRTLTESMRFSCAGYLRTFHQT